MSQKKKTQTIGYRYGLTLHMGICHGPVDSILKVELDDRTAWSGNVTTSENIVIDNFGLFGGDEKEGGVSGTLGVLMGQSTQPKHPTLVASLGANVPAYRGILSFVWGGLVTANNTYLKKWQFTIKRLLTGWNTPVFYPEKIAIGDDMNPVHIVYQCLTDTEWGMGYPVSSIDVDNFTEVADVLHAENFGLSMIWNQQGTIEAFLQIVFQHIGGSLFLDQRTGLFNIRLIRYDYDVEDLPIFDDSNIKELTSFQRAGWGETVNEITLSFTDPITRKDTTITVQDLANIQAQGTTIGQSVDFPAITNPVIASQIAMRELLSRSSPIARVGFKIKRKAWDLTTNDVFVLRWPKLGLENLVMRVGSVNYGSLENGTITVEAAEDIYGLQDGSYVGQQPPGWENPQQAAAPSPARQFVEATYFDLATSLSTADLATIADDVGFAIMYAQKPSSLALDYTLKTRLAGTGSFKAVDTSPHAPTALLADDLIIEEFSTFSIASIVGNIELFEIGDYVIIDNEYMRVDSLDLVTNSMTVARGVIDTLPQPHTNGAKIFFAETIGAVDGEAWPEGVEVEAKVITITGSSQLSDDLAPIDSLEIAARQNKPYPPAKFRINGDYMPISVSGIVSIGWEHRNRLIQTVYPLAQDEASVAPETGTTYTIKVYDQSDLLCRTLTGITANNYIYPVDDEFTDCGGMQSHLRIELFAVRDGIESWQMHSHRFERVYTGWGFNWGDDWGNE